MFRSLAVLWLLSAVGLIAQCATSWNAAWGFPDLLVVPDILQLYVTTTGSLESSFFLPATPPIVGLDFYHQLVPFEFDALGSVVAVTATNALQLTAGVF